jgi:hypothetical protein
MLDRGTVPVGQHAAGGRPVSRQPAAETAVSAGFALYVLCVRAGPPAHGRVAFGPC